MRMNQHRMAPSALNRPEEGGALKSLSSLEVKHSRHMRLNNKYIASLDLVVQTKLRQLQTDDKRLAFDQQLNHNECTNLSPEKIRAMTKANDCSLLSNPSKTKRFLEFRKTYNLTDEYGGTLEPIPEQSNSNETSSSDTNDVEISPIRDPIYGPRTNLLHTRLPGMGLLGRRKPKLCSSLPPAPPIVSMEKSTFSKSLRGPLTRSLLDTPSSSST